MKTIDTVIIGSGPAGLSSALYLARSKRDIMVIEAGVFGGQMFLSHLVENYPGFIEPIKGHELSMKMKAQVDKYGVVFKVATATSIEKQNNYFIIKTSSNEEIKSKTVILASGSKPRKIGIEGEDKYYGLGVSYCSTCDGMFFKNKNVVVVGGGSSAIEGVDYLSRICTSVKLVHRKDTFRAEKILVDRVKEFDNVEFFLNYTCKKIIGGEKVKQLIIKSNIDEQEKSINCDGIFIYIGYLPQNSLVKNLCELDEQGYIKVDKDYKTSLNGLFACGDIISKDIRQISTAVGDGTICALKIDKYLSVN
jgi:thioredoxin reductase (NADPH)